jgi:hypothetical protein
MTMPIDQPKKGRKRGPKAQKSAANLEQLTVRLEKKWRFGIELMSRANHQSLGQAVEWAIKVACNTVKVNSVGTLSRLVDTVWTSAGFELLWRLWELEPNLLTLEERSIIRLVKQADDLFIGKGKGKKRQPDFQFIDAHIVSLRTLAATWQDLGFTHALPHLRRRLMQETALSKAEYEANSPPTEPPATRIAHEAAKIKDNT